LAAPDALIDTKLHALAALQSLSVDDRIKMLIVEEGFITEMVKFLQISIKETMVIVETAATISNLTTIDETHQFIMQMPVLKVGSSMPLSN
jgi:hypothetical protein